MSRSLTRIKMQKIGTPEGNYRNCPKNGTSWVFSAIMRQKDAGRKANSVDPDQTAPVSSLIWVCTVCSD